MHRSEWLTPIMYIALLKTLSISLHWLADLKVHTDLIIWLWMLLCSDLLTPRLCLTLIGWLEPVHCPDWLPPIPYFLWLADTWPVLHWFPESWPILCSDWLLLSLFTAIIGWIPAHSVLRLPYSWPVCCSDWLTSNVFSVLIGWLLACTMFWLVKTSLPRLADSWPVLCSDGLTPSQVLALIGRIWAWTLSCMTDLKPVIFPNWLTPSLYFALIG